MPGDFENKDQFLLAQVADGDIAAFSRLYQLYYPKVYSFLFNLTRSEADAEDGMQEIFTRMFKNRHTLRDIKSIDAYLFTASKYFSLTLIRKRKRTKYTEDFEGIPLPSPTTPDEELKLKQLREFLENAKAELPPQQRKAYSLSRDHDYSIAQIAAEMKLSESTAQEHVSKALKTLRRKCEEYLRLLMIIVFLWILNK